MLSHGMHLAFCLHRCTPYGGLERNALALASAARERGHRVEIFTRSFVGQRPDAIEIHELLVRAATNVGLDRAFERKLQDALARTRADVVVGFNRLRGLDVFYAADPCFAAVRGALSRTLLANRRQRARRERELAAPTAETEILVLTAGEKQRYVQHYGTPTQRLHVLPPGLRAEFLEPREQPRQRRALLGFPADSLVCLALGSDLARKGLDRSLTALAALPESLRGRVRLVAAGAGRPARLERLARRLGLGQSVRFLPGTTDVLELYRGADLFLHPAREENTGTVLLEAMSQGLPVVCSAACGFAALVAGARGGRVLPEPFEPRDLLQACAELLGSDEQRRALGASGSAAMQAYPMARRCEQALAVIEGAAHARKGSRALGAGR